MTPSRPCSLGRHVCLIIGRRNDGRLRLRDGWQERRAGDESDPPAVADEAAGPSDEDDEAVREPYQVGDVDAEPQQPRGEATLSSERSHPRDVRHARQSTDDRDVAVVAVPVRIVGPTEHATTDDLRRVRATLDAALGDARG